MTGIQAPATQAASRREFMKLGLFGSLAVSTLGTTTLSGCASKPATFYDAQQEKQYFFLTEDDVRLLEGLIPAVMTGALPTDPDARAREINQTIDYLDRGIDGFGEANQAEIRKLFDLLTFAPTRIAAAGLWSPWERAGEVRVDEFLVGWRNSSIGLFNNAYGALVKMIALVEYGMPANWARSGYTGPQPFALEALPQFRQEPAV